jgi:branched-chain amino acid transport system ATP-binding protein
MSRPILALDGVTVRFGRVEALHDVRLDVAAGSLLALVGPNGAGKTTLLEVVSGRRRPTRGTVRFEGADVTGLSPHRIARLGIGRTFQVARLFPALSALDNVLVGVTFGRPGRARPGPAAERRRRAARLLEVVGLADRAGTPARALSLGDQKRLELACALGPEPRLLLLDELAAGLPPGGRAEVVGFYGRLRERGLTVVAIEHGAPALATAADRMVVLDRGRVVADGVPAEVLAAPSVLAAYLGDEVDG